MRGVSVRLPKQLDTISDRECSHDTKRKCTKTKQKKLAKTMLYNEHEKKTAKISEKHTCSPVQHKQKFLDSVNQTGVSKSKKTR